MIKFIQAIMATTVMLVSATAVTNTAVIVSAPRLDNLDLMAVDTAADVTVIDRHSILESGAVSVPDLLGQEANVLIRSTSGNPADGQISMRGFGENSHLRTLVLVDGHTMNAPDMSGINWQGIPLSNVEQVEVIRGGQNVLYGNHALAGVVKITTKRSDGSAVRASAGMGSFGQLNATVEYDDYLGDFDYRVGVSGSSYDGFRSNSTSRATSVNGSVGWYPNDNDVVTVRASAGQVESQMPGSLTDEQMQEDPTQSLNYDGTVESENALATLLYEAERSWGVFRVNSGISYRGRAVDLIRYDNYYDNDLVSLSLGPRFRLGDEESFFMTGADVLYDGLDIDRYLSKQREYTLAEGAFSRLSVAPYAFAQKTIAEQHILSGGLRYEYAGTDNLYTEYVKEQISPTVDTIFGPMPNPDYKNPPDINDAASYEGFIEKQGWAAELNFAKAWSEHHRMWVGYDRVYRYPTLDETASYQGYPLSDPLNEGLDPETGNTFEVGARVKAREWNGSLVMYYSGMDNEIVYDDIQKLNRNLGETRRIGLDAELGWNKKNQYGISTRWSFVDARLAGGEYEGNVVPLVPWAHGSTTAWVYLIPEIRFSLVHSFVSEQYNGNNEENNPNQKLSAYSLWGFRCLVAMSERVDLMLAADNLFDENFASVAYSDAYYPSAGRSFRAGIGVQF